MLLRSKFIITLVFSSVVILSSLILVEQLNAVFYDYLTWPATTYQHGKPYAVQEHTIDSLTNDSTYCFRYVFKDHKANIVTWRWSYDRYKMDKLSKSYGLPLNYFKPYKATSEMRKKRARIKKRALFKSVDGYVVPDYNAIVKKHRAVAQPIYELIQTSLGDSASKTDKIEMMLKFCQDLPYKIPPVEFNNKIIEGLFPPSMTLTYGYGDCDSKTMLFASALSYLPNMEMIVLTVPNHVLIAIKGIPKPYQGFVEYQGEKYIMCQPVGPARLNFGDKGGNYRPTDKFTPIQVFNKVEIKTKIEAIKTEKTLPDGK